MSDSLSQQIRDRLALYLAGEEDLTGFNRWFVPATWNVHRRGDAALEHLVGTVGLALAELQAGDITIEEFKSQIALVANQHDLIR